MSEEELRLPLLDQLLDDDPDSQEEPPPSSGQVYRSVVNALQRDLLELLNTRERCMSVPPGMKELSRSVFAYGVPDVTGANLASVGDRDAFLAGLVPVIKRCDPRFKTVKIIPSDKSESGERILRFRIEATVQVETSAETVAFDFKLEPVTRNFES